MSKNAVCILGLVASIASAIADQANTFPTSWGHWITLAGLIGASVTAWLAKSPINHDDPNTVKTTTLRALVAFAVLSVGSATLTSCAHAIQVQALPVVAEAKTDTEARALAAHAYEVIGAALDVLGHVKAYEAKVNAYQGVPASVQQAVTDTINRSVKALDSTNADIGKTLTSYAAIKARLDPIIADLNTLLGLTKSGGFNWSALLQAAVDILAQFLVPQARVPVAIASTF
jgi:hypothetical protein